MAAAEPSAPPPPPDDKYALTYTFRGRAVTLSQTPRARDAAGEVSFVMPTGWCCWEASNILLRWLADDAHVRAALGGAAAAPPPAWGALRFLDLSAGAGLVALAVASAGAAAVAACDIPEQLPQLRDNVARAGLRVAPREEGARAAAPPADDAAVGAARAADDGRAAVTVLPYYWGADVAQLRPAVPPAPPPLGAAAGAPSAHTSSWWYDVVLVSDIVYIAIRDGREAELEATLTGLAAHVG